jgi:hypothetical protein
VYYYAGKFSCVCFTLSVGKDKNAAVALASAVIKFLVTLTQFTVPVPVCEKEQEINEKYGNYSWPATLLGERVEISCVYNVSQLVKIPTTRAACVPECTSRG